MAASSSNGFSQGSYYKSSTLGDDSVLTDEFLSSFDSVEGEGTSQELTERKVSRAAIESLQTSDIVEMYDELIKNKDSFTKEQKYFLNTPGARVIFEKYVQNQLGSGSTVFEKDPKMIENMTKQAIVFQLVGKIQAMWSSAKGGLPEKLKVGMTNAVELYVKRCFKRDLDFSEDEVLSEGGRLLRDGRNYRLATCELPGLFQELKNVILSWSIEDAGITDPILISELIRDMDNAMAKQIAKAKLMNKRRLEKGKKLFEEERKILAIKLRVAEKKGCGPEEITDKEAEEFEFAEKNERARRMGELLIREEQQQKAARRGRGRRGRGRTTRSRGTRRRGKEAPRASSSTGPTVCRSIPVSKKATSVEELRSQFIIPLYTDGARYIEAARVTKRWVTTDCSEIKAFVDRNKDGLIIERYKYLSDEEIFKQRARHYLPGIDRVLSNKEFRRIYAFPARGGYGIMGELNYGDDREYGIVYFGIDGRKIYHRYFEPIEQVAKHNIFISRSPHTSDFSSSDPEWTSTVPFEFSIGTEGVLSVSFPGEKHVFHMHPVRSDLLDRKFFR